MKNCKIINYCTMKIQFSSLSLTGLELFKHLVYSLCPHSLLRHFDLFLKRLRLGRQQSEQFIQLCQIRLGSVEHTLHDINVTGLELGHHLSFGVLVVEEGYKDQFGWVHLLAVFGVQLPEPVNINVTVVRHAEGYNV